MAGVSDQERGGWLAAFAGGRLLDAVLKLVIRRPRPPYAAAFLHDYSWSFPSGHAMGSLVSYGMPLTVAGMMRMSPPSWRTRLWMSAAAIARSVGECG